MTQHPGVIEQGNPECLHCVLNYAMGKWAQRNGRHNADGVIILDVAEVIPQIAKLIGDLVFATPDAAQQRAFERYAQECLAGAFHHQHTGEAARVSVNRSDRSN